MILLIKKYFVCKDSVFQTINITNAPCVLQAKCNLYKATASGTFNPPAGLWYAYPTYPSNITSAIWS